VAVVAGSSGAGVDATQAVSAAFWARQLSEPVRFDTAAACVLADGPACVVEIGPGLTLESLLTKRPDFRASRCRFVATVPTRDDECAATVLESALARLWVDGEPISYWQDLGVRGYRRIAVPGYPYDRRRYWVDIAPPTGDGDG
jgi:acyl transferase domain-containing protein